MARRIPALAAIALAVLLAVPSLAQAGFKGQNGVLVVGVPGDLDTERAPRLHVVDAVADEVAHAPVQWPIPELPAPFAFDASGSRLVGGWPAWDCPTAPSSFRAPWAAELRDVVSSLPYAYPRTAVCERARSHDPATISDIGVTARDTFLVEYGGDDEDDRPYHAGEIEEYRFDGSYVGPYANLGRKRCEFWQMALWSAGPLFPNPVDPDETFASFSWGTSCDTESRGGLGRVGRGGTAPTFLAGIVPEQNPWSPILDVSPDGRWLLVTENNWPTYGVHLRNVATGASTSLGTDFAAAAVFSPDMELIAAVRADGRVVTIPVDLDGGTPQVSPPSVVTAVPPLPAGAVLAWQPAGTARFEHTAVAGSPGAIDFRSLAVAPPGQSIIMGGDVGEPAWVFGDGTDSGGSMAASVRHTYERPGTFTVTHTVRTSGSGDRPGQKGSHSEDVEIPAPELGVSLLWDLPDGRLPIDEELDATVRVSASDDGVGELTDIAFDDGELLALPDGWEELVDLELVDDIPDAPFALEPGEDRDFRVTITALKTGVLELESAASGKTSHAAPEAVEASAARSLKLGTDFEVAVTTTPDGIDIEHLDPDTGIADPPQPVTATVTVKNVSGAPLYNPKVNLRVIERSIGRNPSAPEPLVVSQVSFDGDSERDVTITPPSSSIPPELLLTVPDPVTGDAVIAPGQTVTITLAAMAQSEGKVDIQAVVSAQEREEDGVTPKRAAGGSDVLRGFTIGQDQLVAVLADDDGEYVVTPGNTAYDPGGVVRPGMIRAGSIFATHAYVKNLSTTQDVTVRILTRKVGNVVGKPLQPMLDGGGNEFGTIETLEPGERLPLRGEYTSDGDGGTSGRVELDITAWYVDPETGDEVEINPSDHDERFKVEQQPGGHPATERRFSIDTSNPAPPQLWVDYNEFELGWMFADSFARGFGKWVDGTYELIQTIATYGSKAPYLPLYAMQTVHRYSDPAQREASRAHVAAMYAQMQRISLADAKQFVDSAVQNAMQSSVTAMETGDYQTMVRGAGEFLGGQAPELVLNAAVPVLYSTRLVRIGGKTTLAAAQEAQELTLASRVAAKGRKGFEPHDAVDIGQARKFWGMDDAMDVRLREYVQDAKITITMRDRSPGSIARLDQGALPKIEMVKAKNVNSIDVDYLGFPESVKDLAVFKEMQPWEIYTSKPGFPTDPELVAKIRARYDQRLKEYYKEYDKMGTFAQQKAIPVPKRDYGLNAADNGIREAENFSVWDSRPFQLDEVVTPSGERVFIPKAADANGRFQPFTGDMDPISITDEAGNIITDVERRKQIYKDLADRGFQHPESMTWDNPAGRQSYYDDYSIDAPDSDVLLAYTPDGRRLAVKLDAGLSQFELDTASRWKSWIFMVGVGQTIDPVEPTPGIAAPPDGPDLRDELITLGLGGADRDAQFADGADTPLVRRNLDGSYSKYDPATSKWTPYTPPPGPVISLPQSTVGADTPAGATRVPIAERDAVSAANGQPVAAWFAPGSLIVFDPGGPNEERAVVAALGSIITQKPLARTHKAGELVAVLPRTVTERPTPTPTATPTASATPTPSPDTPGSPSDPPAPPAPDTQAVKPRPGTGKRAPAVKAPRKLKRGARLTCARGTWTGTKPIRFAYGWQRYARTKVGKRFAMRWTPIRRAAKPAYKIARADIGLKLRCTVTATNAAGRTTATTKPKRIPKPRR